jgi:hypothetical protein
VRATLVVWWTGCLLACTAAPAWADTPPDEAAPVVPLPAPPDEPLPTPADGAACPPGPACWSVSAEYLLWFLREGHMPPLLTTGPVFSGGRLGERGTQVLYGDERLKTRHDDRFFGTRVALDWLNASGTLGVEGRAFFLERDSTYFKAVSDGSTLLARPYTDAATGLPASQIIAGPTPLGWRDGAFVGYSRIELFGEEANAVIPLGQGGMLSCDLLAGSRFLQMRDRLDLTATSHLLPARTTLFGLYDYLDAHNAFYGAQVGLRGCASWGNWFLQLRGTVALGGDDQEVKADGNRTFQTPLVRVVTPDGLSVQPSNAGDHHRGAVDMVSEVGVNLGYRLGRHVTLFGGYTFLYWNNPLRAGDQVDPLVSRNQDGAHPEIPFKSDPFWAQGANVGLQFCW